MGGSRGNAAREERKDGEEVEFYKGDSLSVLQNLRELIWVGLLKVDQEYTEQEVHIDSYFPETYRNNCSRCDNDGAVSFSIP